MYGSAKLAAPVGQVVLEAARVLAVGDAADQARVFEALEAIGEQVGRDVFGRGQEFAEALLAVEQVADDEQCPAVADDVERAGDGAV
jgi:hypothetical protein